MEMTEELITQYLTEKSISDNTRKQYEIALNQFRKYLGTKDFLNVHVNEYLNSMMVTRNGKNEEAKDRTKNTRLKIIRQFAEWLRDEEILEKKEYKKIKKLKVKVDSGEDNRRALEPEEEERGSKLADPLKRMLFWTGINYGLRLTEYIKLKIGHVDLEKRIMTIERSKGKKSRPIKILRKQVPVWREWFRQRKAYSLDHDYVFFTSRGKAGNRSIERYFNEISEKINYGKIYKEQTPEERITSHTLRYTFAVKCWRGGMDTLVLSKILGHASILTTQVYLRVSENEILDKFEEQASRIF